MTPLQNSIRAASLLVVLLVGLAACDAFESSETRILRARQDMANGQTSGAVIEVRNVLKKDPANSEARLLLVELSMQLGDLRRVREELDQLARSGVNTPHTMELTAQVRLALGEAGEVLKLLDSGKLAPAEPMRSVLHARALGALNRGDDAAAEFQKILAADPKIAAARVGLAEVLSQQGRSDDALGLLNQAMQDAPANVDGYLLASQLLLRRGQYAEAESVLTRARQLPATSTTLPQRAMLFAALAEAQLGQGKVAAADATRADLAGVMPGGPVTRLLGARIALAKGEYVNGTAELQRLVGAMPDLLQARMLLGAAHFAQGNFLQAEAQLAQVVERAPDNTEARKLLARVRLQLDRPDAALQVLTPALEHDEGDAQLYALLGAAHLRAGEDDIGLDALEKSVRAQPKDAQMQLNLASAYISAKRYPKAIELLKSMPKVAGDVRRERLLVTAMAAEKGPAVARAELERLIAEQPRNVQLLYLGAAYFVSQREFERAREHLRRALDIDPNDTRALAGLATVEFRAGNPGGAEALLVRAVKANEKEPGMRLALAQLYLARNDSAQARTAIDGAIAAAPGRADVSNAAGLMLLGSQRFDQALERFRRAAELEPKNASYWFNTGRAQLALDQPVAARESIEKSLAIQPDSVAAAGALVLLDLRTSGPNAALARVQSLRQRNPGDPGVMILEGDVRMASKDYAGAMRSYSDAERLRASSQVALKEHAALRLGSLDNPEAPLVRWLALQPEDSRVRLVLAQYYQGAERLPDATAEFETLARQYPNNPVVLNNLAWIYFQRGDRRAEESGRRAHELAPDNAAITDTYGWILLRNQQTARALPLLERAAKAAADDLEIQYHYASALAASGARAQAKEVLQRLVATKREFAERRDVEKLLAELSG